MDRFHDHGDTIAIQYGGSHLVNTMETYRKINQWTSHSRDMVESFKRYYNNSFLDKQRQEAYNLFLGNYTFIQGQPMLWDLSTDYYLHHADPRTWSAQTRKSYINWFTPENLNRQGFQVVNEPHGSSAQKPLSFFDDYWLEYYKPQSLTSFKKMLPIKMNSTYRYVPFMSAKEGKYDLSPFRVRDGNEHASPDKRQQKKEVTIVDPEKEIVEQIAENPRNILQSKRTSLQAILQSQHDGQSASQQSILKPTTLDPEGVQPISAKRPKENKSVKEKSAVAQWTLDQFVTNSLNPSVSANEAHEYQRYIDHPLTLPLVVSNDLPPNPSLEFLKYVNSTSIDAITNTNISEDDLAAFGDILGTPEDPLTVTEADIMKKRYKAYRQWMKGKSLFKQRVDP